MVRQLRHNAEGGWCQITVARARSGRTLAELGGLSGMNARAVSKAVQRMSALLPEDKISAQISARCYARFRIKYDECTMSKI